MKIALVPLMIVLVLFISSCEDNAMDPPIDLTVNAPVIANIANSFTYTVRARNFTADVSGVLTFSSDSLTITVTSSEYASGSAIVAVRDSFNSVIFTDTVRSNKVTAITNFKTTTPKSYAINVAGLTGTLVFVVVGK